MAEIVSPLPGVYYAAPAPDEEPFVKAGDPVKAGQTVGLVEVMKQYSEIKSEVSGTVASVEVTNGDSVTPGTVVAIVDPE